jgi:hypothetical protein
VEKHFFLSSDSYHPTSATKRRTISHDDVFSMRSLMRFKEPFGQGINAVKVSSSIQWLRRIPRFDIVLRRIRAYTPGSDSLMPRPNSVLLAADGFGFRQSLYAGDRGNLHEDGLDLEYPDDHDKLIDTKDNALDIGRITIFFLAIVIALVKLLATSHPVLAVAVLVVLPAIYALWKAAT